jgi:sugar lactone lactonase YvrE
MTKNDFCVQVASAWINWKKTSLQAGPVLTPGSKRSSFFQAAALMLGLAGFVVAQPLPNKTANLVWGQTFNFGTSVPNKGTLSKASLFYPVGVVVDSDGSVYIVDQGNHRVLHYTKGSDQADFLYGQSVFSTNTAAVSPTGLNTPRQVALDGAGGLYISDSFNNRVLHYTKGNAVADVVYGQINFTDNLSNQGGTAPKDVTLNRPGGLAVDNLGGLYVADQGNNRILHYPKGTNIPDNVWGQGSGPTPNYTTGNGSTGQSNLNGPVGVAIDAAGGIYVGDQGNNRVLHFSPPPSSPPGTLPSGIADRVYGQGINNFSSADPNKGGISANTLLNASVLAVDSVGGLYVVDSGNNRVLHYPSGSIAPDAVWGQSDFLTSLGNHTGQVDAAGLNFPQGLTLDSAGNLYIADSLNNRVLKYDAPPPPPVVISGITTIPSPPVAGQPFSFTISGAGFIPANALVNLSGPNCPPCVATLSSTSTTQLGGSITLQAAGTYTVTVQNGAAGTPSAGFALSVSAAQSGSIAISGITTVPSPPVAGQPFSFVVSGSNFNPATVLVNFTGPNCTPCVATLQPANTASQLAGSITLQTAGTYAVTAQNGAAGTASAPVSLTVSTGLGQTSVKALPQVVFGGGWYTALYFNNSTPSPGTIAVKLFNADGTPLTIPGASSNATNLAVPGNGTTILEFQNLGSLQQGWAQLILPAGVTSYAVFRQSIAGQPDQEAVVPTSSVSSASSMLIFDNTAYVTAAAFVNPSASAETITITATDAAGQAIGTSTVTLPPNGRIAATVHSLDGLGNTAGKRGSLTFSTPGGAVVVLGLRFNGAAFTSIPAIQN